MLAGVLNAILIAVTLAAAPTTPGADQARAFAKAKAWDDLCLAMATAAATG